MTGPRGRGRFLLVYATTASEVEAARIAEALLRERLVACAHVFPVASRYWWKGKIEKSREYGMILKTRKGLYRKVEAKIKALHSYSVPAIVAWELAAGSRTFLEWIQQETRAGD
jgi:periplasmic divalent cation tolerance protein